MRLSLPLLLLPLLLLSGCAAQRGHDLRNIDDWESRKTILAATTRWEFSGRIGVSAGTEGFNGKIWWWQRDDYYRATISGPLGVGSIRIDGEDRRVTVIDEDGDTGTTGDQSDGKDWTFDADVTSPDSSTPPSGQTDSGGLINFDIDSNTPATSPRAAT